MNPLRTTRIPEEVFIVTIRDKSGIDKTPVGLRPFYDRQDAELAAAKMDKALEVTGYHIIQTVTLN